MKRIALGIAFAACAAFGVVLGNAQQVQAVNSMVKDYTCCGNPAEFCGCATFLTNTCNDPNCGPE